MLCVGGRYGLSGLELVGACSNNISPPSVAHLSCEIFRDFVYMICFDVA